MTSNFELTRKNYFSKEAESLFLGSTSFKNWDIQNGGCEAREVARMKGEYTEKDATHELIGHYVHTYFSGDLQEFMQEHPELFKKDGTLYAKYEHADTMINTLKNDPVIMQAMGGESEVVMTGTIAGVLFKIMVDKLNIALNSFCDIKTTKSLNETYWKNGHKVSFIEQYDYKTQFAIYAEVIRQNMGVDYYLYPYIIAVDKQEIPNHEFIYMGKDFISERLEYIEWRLTGENNIMEARNGLRKPEACGKCDYCRSVKRINKPISIEEYHMQLGII